MDKGSRQRRKRSHSLWQWPVLLALAPALALLLMACSDEEEDPQQAFCSDLEEFQTDLRAVVDAIGSLNRSEIEDAIDEARTSAAELRSSGQELRAGEAEQIESAFNDLRESVEAVGQGGGLQASLRSVQASAEALGTAVRDAVAKYNCE